MLGMPCRPLFLLLFCLSLLFFIVALKAEIENLAAPHAPSLKNCAIPIESADQSPSDGEAETGTMTVPQLAPESGFGINMPLASLFLFGLLEVAMSASVGKLKSKFRPLLLIICCLSIVQSELPPQLQRAKECQEVKTLCPCGYGKCIPKEWSSASPCCVANYTFECCVPNKPYPRVYPMQRPVFTLCLDFEKFECASCGGHASCVFVGNQKDNPVSACCPQFYKFQCCPNISTTTTPTTTTPIRLNAEFCQNKSVIKEVCTECDSYRCIPKSVGFSDSGCCRNDNEFRCCSRDRLITKPPTTTSTPLCNKAFIKAFCTECDVYRCIPNIGFHGGGCCYPDHEFRCCSSDKPATQPTTAILPTTESFREIEIRKICANKTSIKEYCKKCDFYRCVPNNNRQAGGCCPAGHDMRCCSEDEPLQDVTTTITETTTTTTEMSTMTTTEPEQETPSASTEPSSTAENVAGVEAFLTIFSLVMSLWAMERLLPI